MFDFFLYRNAWRGNLVPHREMRLSENQWKALLKKGGLFVRNTYDFDIKEENSFWYLIKDNFTGFDELTSKTRNKIRKAFKTYNYQLVNKKYILENGYDIVEQTFAAYNIKDRGISKQWFVNHIDQDEKDYDFWACFEKETGRFVGFTDVHLWEDACEYRLMCIIPDCRKNSTYPYYGLIYSLNEYYLGEKKMRYVTDGARSITEHSNIQAFLTLNFNFRKAYCKLDLHYQWWFGIIVKILFPFRKLINIPNVKAILRQEDFFRTQNNF